MDCQRKVWLDCASLVVHVLTNHSQFFQLCRPIVNSRQKLQGWICPTLSCAISQNHYLDGENNKRGSQASEGKRQPTNCQAFSAGVVSAQGILSPCRRTGEHLIGFPTTFLVAKFSYCDLESCELLLIAWRLNFCRYGVAGITSPSRTCVVLRKKYE